MNNLFVYLPIVFLALNVGLILGTECGDSESAKVYIALQE